MTMTKSRRGESASRRKSHPITAASGDKAYNSGIHYYRTGIYAYPVLINRQDGSDCVSVVRRVPPLFDYIISNYNYII
jgi:hypothetical protein